VEGALRHPGATDWDIREGLESLIRTYRGLESGLLLDSRPVNLFAADISESVQARVSEIKRRIAEADSASRLEDSTVLALLVFLQRLEFMNNNGRKRSRAFLDFLMQFHVPAPELSEADSLEPEAARVIL
jgi:hypothetical protein